MDAPNVRVVTPAQFQEGYLELCGVVARERPFLLVRKLADGNMVVREPQLPPERRRELQRRLTR